MTNQRQNGKGGTTFYYRSVYIHDRTCSRTGGAPMKIGTKLGLGTGTLLILGLVIGTVSYFQNASVHEKLDELTSVREPVNMAAHDLKKRVFEATSATLGYFMTGD